MVVKNIIAEDMPFTKSIFEQFWRSYCKKTIFVVFHFLKFLPYSNGFRICVYDKGQRHDRHYCSHDHLHQKEKKENFQIIKDIDIQLKQ